MMISLFLERAGPPRGDVHAPGPAPRGLATLMLTYSSPMAASLTEKRRALFFIRSFIIGLIESGHFADYRCRYSHI